MHETTRPTNGTASYRVLILNSVSPITRRRDRLVTSFTFHSLRRERMAWLRYYIAVGILADQLIPITVAAE